MEVILKGKVIREAIDWPWSDKYRLAVFAVRGRTEEVTVHAIEPSDAFFISRTLREGDEVCVMGYRPKARRGRHSDPPLMLADAVVLPLPRQNWRGGRNRARAEPERGRDAFDVYF
jgi:hypothetical protein